MKISNWIRLIGILCIVFGISGVFDNILPFLFSELNESSGEIVQNPSDISVWLSISNFTGIFVRLLYLLAGILFLMKKPYSLWLMYCSLTISILHVLILTLIDKLYDKSIPRFYIGVSMGGNIGFLLGLRILDYLKGII